MTEQEKQKEISQEYKEFAVLASELTAHELVPGLSVEVPLEKNETRTDRYTKHLIGMLEMYSIKYGDAEERLRIAGYLGGQLFQKDEQEIALNREAWDLIINEVLKGRYKDLTVKYD